MNIVMYKLQKGILAWQFSTDAIECFPTDIALMWRDVQGYSLLGNASFKEYEESLIYS
jgi:hypothetical protein